MAYKSKFILLLLDFTACGDCCVIHGDKAVAAGDTAAWLGFVYETLVTDEVYNCSVFYIPPLLGMLLSLAVAPMSFLLCSPDSKP